MSTQTPCHNILQTRPFDRISGCMPVPSGGSSTTARREYRSYPTLNPSLGGRDFTGNPTRYRRTGVESYRKDRILPERCKPVRSIGFPAARPFRPAVATRRHAVSTDHTPPKSLPRGGTSRKPDSLPTHRRGILPERPDTSERCKPVRSKGFPAACPFRPAVATRRHAVNTRSYPT